jgi:hypothetical protein
MDHQCCHQRRVLGIKTPQLFKREFSVGKERGGGQRDVAGPVLSPQAFRARGIGRAVELLAAGPLAQPGELSGTLSGLTVIARTAPCRSVQPGHHGVVQTVLSTSVRAALQAKLGVGTSARAAGMAGRPRASWASSGTILRIAAG